MRKLIVILTGEIASGKTSLSRKLEQRYSFHVLSTSNALKEEWREKNGSKSYERPELIDLGDKLDRQTNGAWVVDHFQSLINRNERLVVDSIRIKDQIDAFRKAYASAVVHIHLKAPANVLRARYVDRKDQDKAENEAAKVHKYHQFKASATESKVHELEQYADLVINTDFTTKDDNLTHAASFLRLLAPIDLPLVDVIIGGQFGSEGKGQVAAYLANEYDCLVRVGGPNAGHKVYHEDADGNSCPYTFRLVPSGCTSAREATIVIGPGAVINKDILLREIISYNLGDRIIVDENATIISQSDITNERKVNAIGGTAQGVGYATAANLRNRLKNIDSFKAKNCKEFINAGIIGSAHEVYETTFSARKKILLEGTQGTFLDLHHGYYPYVTSRGTTVAGCLSEAGIGPRRLRKTILVTRRYPIRVANPLNGTSGPFGDDNSLDPELSRAELSKRCGVSLEEITRIEKTSTTKNDRRIAEFNWALFRRACELNTPTDIAFTFADYISVQNQDARRLDQLTPETIRFIQEMERCASIPVSLIATRFDYRAIIDRRKWI